MPRGGKVHDLIGERFGRLVVIRRAEQKSNKSRQARWSCQCDCGKRVDVTGTALVAHQVVSCSCWKNEQAAIRCRESRTTHGMTDTPAWRSWKAMFDRCRNPNHTWFKHYGGRGIKIAAEFETFEGFFAVVGERPPGTTLDRIDTNGDYSPGNVRWATQREQMRNCQKPPKVAENDIPRIVAMRLDGSTFVKIEESFGISCYLAKYYFDRYGSSERVTK